ncbi:MAG: hypothetical protein FJ403_22015 [Verrucomicrobia bacterium]|nr:hypothetical protein [Verrucomicrobiota bacterium]
MATQPISEIASNYVGFRLARILNDNTAALTKSIERLTSGLRIVSAGDDPSGAAISVKHENAIARMGAAQDGIANTTDFVETQSDFLSSVSESLTRMSELAVLSQSGSTTDAQRSAYQIEFSQLQLFVSDVGNRSFNQLDLFRTSSLSTVVNENGGSITLQSSLNYHATAALGGFFNVYNPTTVDISATASAAAAQAAVSTAITNLTVMQSRVSGNITVLNLYDDLLTDAIDNLTATKDRITAVDTATESAEFSRLDLLTQTGTSMIANWNTLRTNLLDLYQFPKI